MAPASMMIILLLKTTGSVCPFPLYTFKNKTRQKKKKWSKNSIITNARMQNCHHVHFHELLLLFFSFSFFKKKKEKLFNECVRVISHSKKQNSWYRFSSFLFHSAHFTFHIIPIISNENICCTELFTCAWHSTFNYWPITNRQTEPFVYERISDCQNFGCWRTEEIYCIESISLLVLAITLPLNFNVSIRQRNDQPAIEFQISFRKAQITQNKRQRTVGNWTRRTKQKHFTKKLQILKSFFRVANWSRTNRRN